MAQTIVTKYKAPTNTRGSRITVESWNGRTTYNWDYALEVNENHNAAIAEHITMLEKKAAEFNIKFHVVAVGCNPKGDGYTAVVI